MKKNFIEKLKKMREEKNKIETEVLKYVVEKLLKLLLESHKNLINIREITLPYVEHSESVQDLDTDIFNIMRNLCEVINKYET